MNLGLYHEGAGTRRAGGIATFVREIACAVSRKDDHQAYLYTVPGEVAAGLADSAVEVVTVPRVEGHRAFEAVLDAASPLRRQQIPKTLAFLGFLRSGLSDHVAANVDALVTHQYLDDLLVSRVVDVPVVFEYHGFPGELGPGSRCRECLSATDYHLANSRDTARRVAKFTGRKVGGVVPPGVDVDRFRPGVEPAFDPDAPALLFVGRLVEEKGVDDLLAALARLDADPRLFLAGRGDVEGIVERARSLGVADRVSFLGVVPHAELAGYYAAADVVCLPSAYESYGMANLEAMACGRPVVTTDVGGVSEYATDSETAILCSPGDVAALAEGVDDLLASPALRREIGRAAREAVETLTWEARATTLVDFCSNVR